MAEELSVGQLPRAVRRKSRQSHAIHWLTVGRIARRLADGRLPSRSSQHARGVVAKGDGYVERSAG